jgi:hypothetical protein
MTRSVEQPLLTEWARSGEGGRCAGFDVAGVVRDSNAANSAPVVREATVDDCSAIAHVSLETARVQYSGIVADTWPIRLPDQSSGHRT